MSEPTQAQNKPEEVKTEQPETQPTQTVQATSTGSETPTDPTQPQNNKQSNGQVHEVEQLVANMKLDKEKKKQEESKSEGGSHQDPSSKQNQNQLLDETKYFVEISKQNIPFGKIVLFPGSIEEVDVSIGLKEDSISDTDSTDPLMLRVIAKCTNTEFDALDQYVFSVRSNDRFQYFEQVRFKIRKREKAQVKVAVKIPPVKQNYNLGGILEIQLEGLKPVCLPITAKCQLPQIVCLKDLFKADQECSMIKVPAKKNQIRMPPIPFKNLSNFNFTLQVETITNENFSNRAYDIVSQNFVNCQANMQFFVNLQLKQNINYKGTLPLKDTIRKILVLKIKNSSVYFNYPLQVNVYESTNSGGMS